METSELQEEGEPERREMLRQTRWIEPLAFAATAARATGASPALIQTVKPGRLGAER